MSNILVTLRTKLFVTVFLIPLRLFTTSIVSFPSFTDAFTAGLTVPKESLTSMFVVVLRVEVSTIANATTWFAPTLRRLVALVPLEAVWTVPFIPAWPSTTARRITSIIVAFKSTTRTLETPKIFTLTSLPLNVDGNEWARGF